MKRTLAVLILLIPSIAWTHPILRDASTLTRGIVPNERLNPSSVTLQGNEISISTVASGLQSIRDSVASTQTAFYNYTSTADTRMNLFNSYMSTSDTRQNLFNSFMASATTDIDDLYTGVNSTRSVLVTAINSTGTAFRNFTSTSDIQQTTFRNFSTTGDVKNDDFNAFQSTSDAQQTKFQNFRSTTDTSFVELGSSSQNKTGSLSIEGNLAFKTTYYFTAGSQFITGNTTNTVTFATSPVNGCPQFDHNTDTTGLNSAWYKFIIPENYVAGSTWSIRYIASMSTGASSGDETYTVDFATQGTNGLPINNSGTSALTFSRGKTITITGIVSALGGMRENKNVFVVPALSSIIGPANSTLWVRVTRNGRDATDTSNTISWLAGFVMTAVFQQ